MITILSGSRRITDPDIIERAVRASGFAVTGVIEGGQRTYKAQLPIGGIDWLARQWAEQHGIPCVTMNAEWNKYGLAAGPLRNRQMAAITEQLIAIPDSASRGTRNMITVAIAAGLSRDRIFIYEYA